MLLLMQQIESGDIMSKEDFELLLTFVLKMDDISGVMSSKQSIVILLEIFDCEPDVFEKFFPFLIFE